MKKTKSTNKRPRAHSHKYADLGLDDNDDQSLTSTEKQELLSTFPSDVQLNGDLNDNDNDDHNDDHKNDVHRHASEDDKDDKDDKDRKPQQLNENVDKNEDGSEEEQELDVIKMNNDDESSNDGTNENTNN